MSFLKAKINKKEKNTGKKKKKDIEKKKGRKKGKETDPDQGFFKRKSHRVDKTNKSNVMVNNTLLNHISPQVIEFTRNSTTLSDTKGAIYGVTRYPQTPEYGWMSKLCNLPNAMVSIHYQPLNPGAFTETLNKSIERDKGTLINQASKPKDIIRAEQGIANAEKMFKRIENDGEAIGNMAFSYYSFSKGDAKSVQHTNERVAAIYQSEQCKTRLMNSQQEDALKNLLPFYPRNDDICERIFRPVPISAFFGGFPFASKGFNDGRGHLFGEDNSGSMVVVDPEKRGEDRTNSNFTILGPPGLGKSATIKDLIISEYAFGTKIIILDPESEYVELTKRLGGDHIDASGGEGRINPLEVRVLDKQGEFFEDDDIGDNTDEDHGLPPLALHLQWLEVFFRLKLTGVTGFGGLTDVHLGLLKKAIIECYKNFNIDFDTDFRNMQSTDYPILSDLFEVLSQHDKNSDGVIKEKYQELLILLEDMVSGGEKFLFNGPTTVRRNSNIVCLDTNAMQSVASDQLKRTQYYNLLSWSWGLSSSDREQKYMIVSDEAYLMLDPNVKESAVFLKNVEKRGRKYNVALVVASHSIVDFLHEKIRMEGQALLNLPTYKIFFGCDGVDLEEITKLYSLTEAEVELLSGKKRARALMFIGSKRLGIKFIIPEYKLKLSGKAGGR